MTGKPTQESVIIQGWITAFTSSKKWADGAIAQLSDEQLFTPPAPGFNSVAAIMKHIAGNVKSRWTDWRTTDGEKPWRRRETEFDVTGLSARICNRCGTRPGRPSPANSPR